MAFFGPETDLLSTPPSPKPTGGFVGPEEDTPQGFVGPEQDLASPQDVRAAMQAPGSTFFPTPEQSSALRAHDNNRSLPEKISAGAGAAWEAGKHLATEEFPRLVKGTVQEATAAPLTPKRFLVDAPFTAVEAATRGTMDLVELARRGWRAIEDGPDSIFGYVPDPNSILGKIFPTDTDEKYHARVTDNLANQRVRQEMAEGRDTALTFRKPVDVNQAGAELGSYVLDPSVLAPGAKLPAGLSRALGQTAAKGVSAASKGVGATGSALKAAAKIPEELAAKVLPESIVKPAAIGGAVAGAIGAGGLPAQAAAVVKGAQATGAAMEKAGEFGQALAKTSGNSQFSRLEQIAMSEGSPTWVRGAARNLARLKVDKAAGGVADAAGSVAKGGAVGAAITIPGAENAEEIGQGVGAGGAIGGLAHVALAPFASGAKKRAAEDADIIRWYESKAPEEQAALSQIGLDRSGALKAMTAEALANGVLSPNANVKFTYLPGPEFEAQFGNTRGVQIIKGEVPQLVFNADLAKGRTIYHELFHALDSAPDIVDFGSLSRLLFDITDDKGQVITKGLLNNEDLKRLGDQYISRFDEVQRATWAPEKEAFEANPLAAEGVPWRTRVTREVAAEFFANLAEDTSGSLIKDAGSLSRRVLDAAIQAESPKLRAIAEKLSPSPKATSDIFPGLKATPQVYAAMRDAVRKKGEMSEKPEFDPEANTDTVAINPAEALKPGGDKIIERFADNDVFKKDAQGQVMMAGGRPILLTEGEIKKVQANRVKAISDAVSKVPDTGESGVMRPVDGGFEGNRFSENQLKAIEALPNDILTPSMKEKIRRINGLIEKGDGSPILLYYNAATSGGKDRKDAGGVLKRGSRKYSSKIRESIRVVSPLNQRVTKAGNYIVTGLDITAFSNKLSRWHRDKKSAFRDFDGSQEKFTEAAFKYLENHANGRPGETGLDADAKKALRMKNRINDFFNIRDKASEALNPDRLSSASDKDNLIRSFRFDRINRVEQAAGDNFPVNYQLQKANFSPGDGPIEISLNGKSYKGKDHDSAISRAIWDGALTGWNDERIPGLYGSENGAAKAQPLTPQVDKQASFSPSRPDRADEDGTYDFVERYDKALESVVSAFEASKKGDIYKWPKVRAARLKRVWLDFGKSGVVRDEKGAAEIRERILSNIALLRVTTELMAHSERSPKDVLEPHGEFSDSDIDRLGDFLTDADGSYMLSDYGLPRVEQLYQNLFSAETSEEIVLAADKILNVIHQRSDMAGFFVEGGTKTLNEIASQGGYVAPDDAAFSPDAPEKKAPTFYSTLEKVIDSKVQGERIPAAQLAAILRNPQNGVKAEELKWSGIEQWLQEKQGRVTKAEVLEFVKANEIKVEEVEKGKLASKPSWDETTGDEGNRTWDLHDSETGETAARIELIDDVYHVYRGDSGRRVGRYPTLEQAMDEGGEYGSAAKPSGDDATKFEQYQLPGGENYRELLFTLPRKVISFEDYMAKHWGEKWRDIEFRTNQRENYERAVAEARGGADEGKLYKSSHWDEPNVLAHVRFNERTDAEGKRVLFIEEIQSDWHQEGRKKGYKEPYKREELRLSEGRDELERQIREFKKRGLDTLTEDQKKELGVLFERFAESKGRNDDLFWYIDAPGQLFQISKNNFKTGEAALEHVLTNKKKSGSDIPDAPFKNTWHEFTFKRMLRWAAENNFDRVAWTTGEMQAARYDLSKQVKSVEYNPETQRLFATSPDGGNVLNQQVAPEKVEDYIGKEAASRLFAAKPKEVWIGDKKHLLHSLEGEALKVGGEGMKGFYDKMLPDFARKYAKRWGAVVKQVKLAGKDPYRVVAEARERGEVIHPTDADTSEKVWGLDVTPAMKKTVLEEGQPMFSPRSGGGDKTPASGQNPRMEVFSDEVSLLPRRTESAKAPEVTRDEKAGESVREQFQKLPPEDGALAFATLKELASTTKDADARNEAERLASGFPETQRRAVAEFLYREMRADLEVWRPGLDKDNPEPKANRKRLEKAQTEAWRWAYQNRHDYVTTGAVYDRAKTGTRYWKNERGNLIRFSDHPAGTAFGGVFRASDSVDFISVTARPGELVSDVAARTLRYLQGR